jgi:NADH dehydrogenase
MLHHRQTLGMRLRQGQRLLTPLQRLRGIPQTPQDDGPYSQAPYARRHASRVGHLTSRRRGVETRVGVEITAIEPAGVRLRSGEIIPAATVVWCAGMRVKGVPHVFAAGDAAWALLDDHHASVISCQHGRPMGRFAGHNVVCDLFGLPLLPLRIPWYVTVLDLRTWGAVHTEGWDRQVVTTGQAAKQTKQMINCQRIYPPLTGKRQDILAAAAPVIQQPPERYREPAHRDSVTEPDQHG